ncbi:hypothetical protein [Neorhodopirellula pilleata]|nr:hypothetical protein [Neorhodopirellula pilleata]
MFCRNRYTDFDRDDDAIARIRCGRIVMEHGKLVSVERHLWSSPVSIAQVWWESERGRIRGDVCYLDYHIPRGLPQFITLDYIRSGQQTRYRTFIGACHILNEIAKRRQSAAIVAHVTNARISDRLLQRQGWERHMPQWRGRHFIRRFYEGYPSVDLTRYA